MQDIQEVEKHCIGSGIVHSDLQWQNNMETFTLEAKEQVRLLQCIQTVCYLANCVCSLFNRKRFRW